MARRYTTEEMNWFVTAVHLQRAKREGFDVKAMIADLERYHASLVSAEVFCSRAVHEKRARHARHVDTALLWLKNDLPKKHQRFDRAA